MSFYFSDMLRQRNSKRSTEWRVRCALVSAILLLLASSACASNPIGEGEKMKKTKAPFKVLFSNDFTGIGIISPHHKKGDPLVVEKALKGTIDETAGTGVEVHMLQPAHGWVPWWQSNIYPMEEHHKWWKEHYGVEPRRHEVHDFILEGNDPFELFVKRCREKGLSPFVSYRMNDAHHLHNVNREKYTAGPHGISRFYAEHPEYRIDPSDGGRGVQNWAIPEVREHKFAFLEEMCEKYDIEGFELDFMRMPQLFRTNETTSEQRVEIMIGFIKQVRDLLDRTARPGQHRWLCVRMPAFISEYDALGFDPARMSDAGVEMFNLSISYFTEQQTDLPRIRTMVPDAAIYLEMCHTTETGKRVTKGGGDNMLYRRTTDEQYYTTAHLAYSRGADGVSAFNFVYYREHGTPGRGPFNEPPFHIFKHMGDPKWLARQPQHYFISERWYVGQQLPKTFELGKTISFNMDMAPPAGGWKKGGKLRIQSHISLGDSKWTVRLNGVSLEPNSDVSEPYPNPYPPMLGIPEELRAWSVPADALKDGMNKVDVTMVAGGKADIVFIDLGIE